MVLLRNRRWAIIVVALMAAGTACTRSPQSREAAFLKRGLALEARRDYARAILEFRNAGRAMPGDPEPEYRLGMAYLRSGRTQDAMTALRRAVELNPNYAPAQLKLADLMLNSRNRELIEQAADQLQTMINSGASNAAIASRLALADWSLGKKEEAEKWLQRALDRFPADLASSVALARLKLQRNDTNGALEVLRQAERNSPHSVPAMIALGELYAAAGRRDEAEAELRGALASDPRNGMALLGLASLQMSAGKQGEAEATLRMLSDIPDWKYNGAYGEFLLQAGRTDAALAEFERQARKAPDDRGARSRLVSLYLQLNRLADAGRLLDQALKTNPKDTDALLQRSTIALRTGRTAEAEADLNQVLEFVPNAAEAHFALAALYKARGLARNQRQELHDALRLNSNLLPARLWLVQSLLVAGDNEAALSVLDQAPPAQQQLLAVVIERTWALLFLGRSREARTIVDRALSYGSYPELLLQDAVLKMREGKYAEARAVAGRVLQGKPEEARAARVLIDSYVAQNQSAKAGEWLLQTVAAHPQSAGLQNLMGNWYEALHDDSRARQAYAAALALVPNSLQDVISLAAIDLRQNRVEEARERAAQALAIDGKDIKALLLAAEVADRSGRLDLADSYYRQVLAVDGNNVMALNNLANHLAKQGSEEALGLAQQALQAAPDNPGVQDTLGWIYYRKGMYELALKYLKPAAARDPNPVRRFHLGLAYLKTGERALGNQMVTLALHADPALLGTETP